jgi:hypothetical protein
VGDPLFFWKSLCGFCDEGRTRRLGEKRRASITGPHGVEGGDAWARRDILESFTGQGGKAG